MAIKEFQINFTGQGVNPRFGHLLTSDSLDSVVAPGYLNPYMKSQGFSILPTDFIFVVSTFDNSHQIYQPVFNGGVVTLSTF